MTTCTASPPTEIVTRSPASSSWAFFISFCICISLSSSPAPRLGSSSPSSSIIPLSLFFVNDLAAQVQGGGHQPVLWNVVGARRAGSPTADLKLDRAGETQHLAQQGINCFPRGFVARDFLDH